MALNNARDLAFGFAPLDRDSAGKRRVPKRPTYQMNCRISAELRPLLMYVAAKEGVTQGDLVEPLIVAYLVDCGYIAAERASELGFLVPDNLLCSEESSMLINES